MMEDWRRHVSVELVEIERAPKDTQVCPVPGCGGVYRPDHCIASVECSGREASFTESSQE